MELQVGFYLCRHCAGGEAVRYWDGSNWGGVPGASDVFDRASWEPIGRRLVEEQARPPVGNVGTGVLNLVDLAREHNGQVAFSTVAGFFEIECRIPVPGQTDGSVWAERMVFDSVVLDRDKVRGAYIDRNAEYLVQRFTNALNQHKTAATEGV